MNDVSETTPPTLAAVSIPYRVSDHDKIAFEIRSLLNSLDLFTRAPTKGRSDPSSERIAQSHDSGALGPVSSSSR